MFNLLRKLRFAPVLALLTIPAWGDSVLYTTGPINGTFGGDFINSGYAITDSFVLSSNSTITDLSNIGVWVDDGDTLTSLNWTISTAPDDGGTVELSETNVTPSSATELTPTGDYGDGTYNVYNVSFSVPDLSLAAGTYYLTLENAVTADANPAFWDINNCCSGNAVQYYSGSADTSDLEVSFEVDGSTTPEPASLILLSVGLAAVALQKKIRQRLN